jgi:dihydroflavonol-4-reductase
VRAFLTGGSGFLGGALLAGLLERGDQVVALARSDDAAAALSERGATIARGHTLDEEALVAGMRGCDIVYHVAGINTMCPEDPVEMIHVNVRGAEAAVRAAGRAGIERLVLTSSAASLGEERGTVGRTAAGTCRSTSGPSTRARWPRSPPRDQPACRSSRSTRRRCRAPVARAGPGGS